MKCCLATRSTHHILLSGDDRVDGGIETIPHDCQTACMIMSGQQHRTGNEERDNSVWASGEQVEGIRL